MKKTNNKENNINEYLLAFLGPLLGVALVTLPMLRTMTFLNYLILVGEVYLFVIGFALAIFILLGIVMLLARIPIVDKILFSEASKHDYSDI